MDIQEEATNRQTAGEGEGTTRGGGQPSHVGCRLNTVIAATQTGRHDTKASGLHEQRTGTQAGDKSCDETAAEDQRGRREAG